MIHTLHPADVAPLLLFLARSPVNEAETRDRCTGSRDGVTAVAPFVRGYLLERERRKTLVYANKVSVRGVVSARGRNGPCVWEIDHLLLAKGSDEICLDLLEKVGVLCGDVGAQKVFLRLDSSSRLFEETRRAGFCSYLTETTYCLDQPVAPVIENGDFTIRRKKDTDEQALFRLYSQSVPHQVRCFRGITQQDWLDSRSRDTRHEFIIERGGEMSAWFRMKRVRRSVQCELLAMREGANLESLVKFCLSALKAKRTVCWLAPDYQTALRGLLERRGFRAGASCCCFTKETVATVKEPQMVPMRA